jgi:8-oxo-dGTP pyrophosphatase MutT (NUDIX family)
MAIATDLMRQAGVIPISKGQVCVVTSRSGRRWVVPKGCLEPGKSSGEIALQEAWEEAGLVGVLAPDPLGTYLYEKAGLTCLVFIYLMDVTEEAADWPERLQRQRCWLSFAQAQLRVEDPGLRELIRAAAANHAG